MLQSLYTEKNKNRSRPCHQAKSDPYRLFFYDLVSATNYSGYSQPLLLRRHNVVTGMVLVRILNNHFKSDPLKAFCGKPQCNLLPFRYMKVENCYFVITYLMGMEMLKRTSTNNS